MGARSFDDADDDGLATSGLLGYLAGMIPNRSDDPDDHDALPGGDNSPPKDDEPPESPPDQPTEGQPEVPLPERPPAEQDGPCEAGQRRDERQRRQSREEAQRDRQDDNDWRGERRDEQDGRGGRDERRSQGQDDEDGRPSAASGGNKGAYADSTKAKFKSFCKDQCALGKPSVVKMCQGLPQSPIYASLRQYCWTMASMQKLECEIACTTLADYLF